MENNETQQNLILVVSGTESFLAKSLVTKLDSMGLQARFTTGDIKEIDEMKDAVELIIYFM